MIIVTWRRNSDKTSPNYGYWLNKQLYDAQTKTSDVEEIRDQQRKRNELPGIHSPNRPCLCWKTECRKATWRNWRERKEDCTHCGQVNEYPTPPTPPLPTPLPPKISIHISSWYQFIFVYFIFRNLILRIFLIIIWCSGMFHGPGFIDGP